MSFWLLGSVALANPSADADCATTVTDPFLGTGTRADLYGCKSIGNSGDEQGIYVINADAADLGYPADYGTCSVLVKWSGNYGLTPYLDYGTVYNQTKCSSGYVEIWGDRFDATDGYGATPYVYSIGGQGTQLHPH
ncbi:MAG TPA: hypothetical protein VFV20_05260 [Candidatus Limnocylindria bacterium]|nr:hypothetical protein [Candidatus Limnocylindria bacterium]